MDVNALAIGRAGLAPEVADWLRQVNEQVEPRLARMHPAWREVDQPEVVEACAFGLLLGHLADRYPHMTEELHRVAEEHPSFTSLPAGKRLETLRALAAEPDRAARWICPLLDLDVAQRVRLLFD